MDDVTASFFGEYYRVDGDLSDVMDELETAVEPVDAYETRVTQQEDEPVELMVATDALQIIFYPPNDTRVNAYVTPADRNQLPTAAYDAFDDVDHRLEQYLHETFSPYTPRSPAME